MGSCISKRSSHTPKTNSSKTSLFTNTVYRIPALIYTDHDQTFLAFAEKRTSFNDADATLLVMRRGTQQNGSIQWSCVRELTTARLDKHRTMNPCPVYEKQSKTVFLFFNCVFGKVSERDQISKRKNQARLCYVTSSDGGQTWSDVTDLTERVIGKEIKNWATFSVGPGHGVQMNDGRLVIPAYVYYIQFLCVKPYAFAFYSDDRGVTWHYGHRVSVESTECEMAEITKDDGQSYLYCNARGNKSYQNYRVEAVSKNRGMDFETLNQKLVELPYGCQGSVVSFQHGGKTKLLFSHTTDRKKRKDLGVYLKETLDKDSGWKTPHIINPGVSGYSDMTRCDEKKGRFACLMERGTTDLEEIAFKEFSLNDIMSN